MARRSAWRHTSGVNNMTSLLEREAGFYWRAARNLRSLAIEASATSDVAAVKPRAGA